MSNTGKQKKKANNKTTSGTGKNTVMLGIDKNTDSSNRAHTKTNNAKKGVKKPNEEKLIELETKTKELKEQLDKINTDIETERNLLMEEKNQYNKEITDQNNEINSLSSENKYLISKLKVIKANLDNKMKMDKKIFEKMEKLKKEEEKLKKHIEVKEKEILLAQKNAKIFISDYNHIKSISDKFNIEKEGEKEGEKEDILSTKLESLKKNKEELENENMNLRKKIKEHTLCQISKEKLTSTLNVLTNAYQFEIKMTNMLDSKKFNLKEKKDKLKREKSEKINQTNRSISYCQKIRKKVLKKMEKKNSERIVIPKRAAIQIAKLCNNITEQYNKKSGDIKNLDNSDYKLKQKTLFTEDEQLQLAPIIPPIYLNEFKVRFDAVENQRYEYVDKLKNTQDEQAKKSNEIKLKLNYSELKKKEQKLLFVDLNSHLSKKNVTIMKLKANINKIMKDYKTWDKLLKMKIIENIRLNKYIDDTKKNKNKSAEKAQTRGIIKKRKKINEKNEEILKKQNSVRLAYDNLE